MATQCEYRFFSVCFTHADGTGFLFYFLTRFIALI